MPDGLKFPWQFSFSGPGSFIAMSASRVIKRVITSFLLMFVCVCARAEILDSRVTQPSPLEKWFTLETQNFAIHFREDHRDYAARMAEIAEHQHAILIEKLNWIPSTKTEIVVNDTVDFSNGASTVYPYNQFFVYMNEPVGGVLQDRVDFTETLFTHEYTHILHLDQAEGVAAFTRKVFGKAPFSIFSVLALPQVFAPHWLSEGIAIYQESASGFGRNNSATFNAMMREEIRTGLASYTEESYEGYYNSRWPFGQVYLYGAYFFQFMEQAYGKEVVLDYIQQFNRNVIPWQMNKRAMRTTGKNAKQLWREFQNYLHDRFTGQIESDEAAGLTNADTLFDKQWLNRLLTPGPDGSVFFYHNDWKNTPEIVQLFPDGRLKVIYRLKGVTSMQWHADSGLLISRPEVCKNTSLYSDLYLLNLKYLSLQRLTTCARLPRASWNTDGSSIIAVHTAGAKNSLVQVSMDGRQTVLSQLDFSESIGQPSVTPSGKILASVKRQGKGWGIEEFDPASGQWRVLLRDNSIVSLPFASSDSESVLFVSDHEDHVELRRMKPGSGKFESLTLSQGFVHQGVEASDGAIWITQYTGDGDQVRRLPLNALPVGPAVELTEHPVEFPDFVNSAEFNPQQHEKVKQYTPWSTLRPRGWAPIFFSDGKLQQAGIQLSGVDVLGFHRWTALPLHYSIDDKNHLGGVFSYSFNNRLSMLASSEFTATYTDDSNIHYDEEQDHLQVLAHYPLNRFDWSMDFSFGIAHETNRRTYAADGENFETRDTLSGFGLSFDSFSRYPHAISRGSGLALDLVVESFDWTGASSDHVGEAAILKSSGNLRVGNNQTLIATLYAGTGDKAGKPFVLGDNQPSVNELGGITRLGEREFVLHGYSKNEALVGKSFLRSTLAWHFPLLDIYNGLTVPPVGLGRLQGNVYVESGDAWDNKSDRRFYQSVGAEIQVEFLIGYDTLSLPVSFGVASGLDEQLGEDVFYLGIDLEL